MANRWGVMSEYCREQHPLLCEEASEEEFSSPRNCRRFPPINYRGQARINHKGAAKIFTRWPDHWSSFLTYWWIAIGMISLTTFIVYNSLFAFSMLSSANTQLINSKLNNENKSISLNRSSLPDVYVHVFMNRHEHIDINQYMPYIENIASTFENFKFNYIIIINDTDVGWLSEEENNELALNMLWTKDKNLHRKESLSHNIKVDMVSLSVYMDNSPLRKVWRILPYQLIEYLARTVSVWDKGGVAFNPDILTPMFQHTLYIQKLQELLNKYGHTNKIINEIKASNKAKNPSKKLKKMNNIRDIINALEKEDISVNAYAQQTLSEAEDRDIQFLSSERHVRSIIDTKIKGSISANINASDKITIHTRHRDTGFSQPIDKTSAYPLEASNNSSKMNLFPLLFLEYLFHNKDFRSRSTEPAKTTNRSRKSIIVTSNIDDHTDLKSKQETEKNIKQTLKPMIVSAPGFFNKSEFYNVTDMLHSKETEQNSEPNKLTIDLKGNIIATDTSCHAFLGTIYSNVIHHNHEETITDFIIAELTIFCKGLFSSCMGIDLILL